MVKNPAEYVKSYYDDQKNLVETILNDGVPVVNAGDARPKRVADHYHYAGEYDGADPDARLDNAIAAASGSQAVIFLEPAVYSADRTISKKLQIQGFSRLFGTDTPSIQGTWDLQQHCRIESVKFDPDAEPALQVNSEGVRLITCICQLVSNEIQVNADRAMINGLYFGTVTFGSGTSSGIVDGCVGTSVTDNGTNTVGDIS